MTIEAPDYCVWRLKYSLACVPSTVLEDPGTVPELDPLLRASFHRTLVSFERCKGARQHAKDTLDIPLRVDRLQSHMELTEHIAHGTVLSLCEEGTGSTRTNREQEGDQTPLSEPCVTFSDTHLML